MAAQSWSASLEGFTDPDGAHRVALFAELLSRFPTGRLVDLGTGHGIFARVAADLGWRVTGVDARDERFPDDPRVRWVRADVRGFDVAGGTDDEVDVVACLGLWYHLTLDDQLDLARRCAPRPLILDTHVAMPHQGAHRAHADRVGPLGEVRGFDGRLYAETGMRTRPTASFGNEHSFWPTEAALERLLLSAGYDVVERIGPSRYPDRWFYVVRALPAPQRERLRGLVARYVPPGPPAASGAPPLPRPRRSPLRRAAADLRSLLHVGPRG
jgi:SAM-dependent methyltransferase